MRSGICWIWTRRSRTGRAVSGPDFLSAFFWLWLGALGAGFWARRLERGSAAAPTPELEAYALTQLARGAQVSVDSAVTTLLAQGALRFDGQHRALDAAGPLPARALQLERAVYEQVEGAAAHLTSCTAARRAPRR